MTAILGGGLSGLSAAYYALENPKLGSIALFEATNKLGGWVSTKKSPTGAIFEQGPRTIRPQGEAGENTLKLVDALELKDKILPIPVTHPTALNRYIYVDQQLLTLPVSFKPLFRTCPPFKRPLIKAIWKDLLTPSVHSDDESVYHFIERRIGTDVADYVISPLICGICAGDAKEISVKFLMPSLFKAEQTHGSLFKGIMKDRLLSKFKARKAEPSEGPPKDPAEMDSVERSIKSNWAVWTLTGGVEQLPQALANNLYSRNAHIRLGTKCKELTFHSDGVDLTSGDETKKYSRVISSLPANALAPLVKNQHPELANELEAIPTVTVGVVNFEFPRSVLSLEAFGFLVPPREELPILGTTFDSCLAPQENAVLTVMMGGAWFEKNFGTNPTEEHLSSVALEHLKAILNIQEEPISQNVSILRDCIPQYIVGHDDRVNRIKNYIIEHNLPLKLCGASYEGIGVNDVIFSAKKAVSDII